MRGLSLGDVTPPPHAPPPPPRPPPWLLPILLLDSLTAAPHLSSFTAQCGETGRSASPPLAPHKDTAQPGCQGANQGAARDGMERLLEVQVKPDRGLEVTVVDDDAEQQQSFSRKCFCHYENLRGSKYLR